MEVLLSFTGVSVTHTKPCKVGASCLWWWHGKPSAGRAPLGHLATHLGLCCLQPSGGSDCSLPTTALDMSLGVPAFVTFVGSENLILQSTTYCYNHSINVILGLGWHNGNCLVSLDVLYKRRHIIQDSQTSKVPN